MLLLLQDLLFPAAGNPGPHCHVLVDRKSQGRNDNSEELLRRSGTLVLLEHDLALKVISVLPALGALTHLTPRGA